MGSNVESGRSIPVVHLLWEQTDRVRFSAPRMRSLKTWIEIDKKAIQWNVSLFKKLVSRETKLMAVVKSNAYGHGLWVFSEIAEKAGVDGFCVDSVIEAATLRERGIKKPILVLGYTLPTLFEEAFENGITIAISSQDGLKALAQSKKRPEFHLKIDTGMHRHGFYLKDIAKVGQFIKKYKLPLKGVFTHFSSAKDVNYPTYTEKQFNEFKKAVLILEKRGFRNLIKHVAATGGTLLNKKYHLDWVRVGIGLYGLWPSKELEIQLGNDVELKPVLSWHTVVSEVKSLKKGDFVGYDLTYRASRDTKIAILPIGYWHGFPRALSGNGAALIHDKEAPVLGRVSMDIIVVDVHGISCKVGDEAVIIGWQGKEEISASELAQKAGTSHYEVVTCLNPLIERKVV